MQGAEWRYCWDSQRYAVQRVCSSPGKPFCPSRLALAYSFHAPKVGSTLQTIGISLSPCQTIKIDANTQPASNESRTTLSLVTILASLVESVRIWPSIL